MKQVKELREYIMMIGGQKGLSVMAAHEAEARDKIERKCNKRPYSALALRAWIEQGRPVVKGREVAE